MRSQVIIIVAKSMFSYIWTLISKLFCCIRKRRPSKGHGGQDEWSDEEGEAMLTSVTVEVKFVPIALSQYTKWCPGPGIGPGLACTLSTKWGGGPYCFQ